MPSGKNKLRVVLDTNIYISALLFGGIPNDIIAMAREGKITLLASSAILLEVGRVLQDKFEFKKRQVLDVIKEVRRIAIVAQPQKKLDVIRADPSDNRVLECAIEGKTDYIVTGDKRHLRPLGTYQNIPILLPSEFVKKI
jgi:putative PIN family toxin of toxin-antitoxin system